MESMPRAQLFVTCLIDSFFPEVGESCVRVLRRAGAQVGFPPDQTCCGQPAFNAGYRDEARVMARRTVTSLEAEPGEIVIPSGSCAAMIRHGYPELFADEPEWLERSRRLAARVMELTQYLVDRLGYQPAGSSASSRLAYHPSCHLLRGLGVERQPRQLLEDAVGAFAALEPDCCGFGGVFSVDQRQISEAMLGRRLEQIRQSGTEAVVGADVGCLMHLEGALRRAGSPVRCRHIAQVLDGRAGGLA
jgi:L-lactate dehydrogenase complex protein LldE